jgi:ArsR family metal-binding transcriptional regulator
LAATRPVRRGAGHTWIREAERRIELYREGKVATFDADDVLEDDEWAAEVERRIAEVDSGEVTPIPIEEARARWRALLR